MSRIGPTLNARLASRQHRSRAVAALERLRRGAVHFDQLGEVDVDAEDVSHSVDVRIQAVRRQLDAVG